MQVELTEKCKRHKIGPKERYHKKNKIKNKKIDDREIKSYCIDIVTVSNPNLLNKFNLRNLRYIRLT